MNAKHLFVSAALIAPVLAAFALPGEKVRFAPAEGSSATKNFESKMELTLDHMAITMNGQDVPGVPEMDMNLTHTQKVGVTDEFVAMGDGRPKKLKRHFDTLTSDSAMSMKMEMMGQSNSQDHNSEAESELDGKTVLFTWDAEAKEFKKALDPAEEKPELLKGLDEDMDLRALLPESEVKVGDEWDVDVKSLVSVLAPGGDLAFKPKEGDKEGMGMGMGMNPSMGSMHDYLSDLLEGEAKAKLADVREEDGAKLAVIKFTVKIASQKDMTDIVQEAMKNTELPGGMEVELDHMDIDFKMEGEGELVWNMKTNQFSSFELSGPVHMNMDMAMKISGQGQNMNMEQALEMSGTNTMSVKST
ncbi:MAG: hypothetical protein HZA53_04140 [Planctomycetes bacterium]|nr:hypothetical protein [Planctomycetota bacterium]